MHGLLPAERKRRCQCRCGLWRHAFAVPGCRMTMMRRWETESLSQQFPNQEEERNFEKLQRLPSSGRPAETISATHSLGYPCHARSVPWAVRTLTPLNQALLLLLFEDMALLLYGDTNYQVTI